MRTRIVATLAVTTALALAASGLLLYVIQSRSLDEQISRSVDQEFAEFAALSRTGVDPATGERFQTAPDLIELYLIRNVPDTHELLVGWWNGAARLRSTPDPLAEESRFLDAVSKLQDRGGSSRLEFPDRGDVLVAVQPIRVNQSTGSLVVVLYLDELRAPLASTMRTYAAVATVAWLVLVFFAAAQSGRLLAPLRTLRNTAQEISETDLSRRIPTTGNDDITRLTETLNAMLGRLESAFSGQRQFLDDAGHELRTPLTILQGHLELLDPHDADDVAETRDLLLDETNRMSRLIDDLIMLTKSERPDFARFAPRSVPDLMGAVHRKATGLADRDWHLHDVSPRTVVMDEQRLTQALLQLCGNAVRHTETGQPIHLGAYDDPSGEWLHLWVGDGGPGVPPADRERIFQRFVRLGSHLADSDADEHGFGLGLSLVAAIASAHNGRAYVTDDPVLGGARFILTIDCRKESAHGSGLDS